MAECIDHRNICDYTKYQFTREATSNIYTTLTGGLYSHSGSLLNSFGISAIFLSSGVVKDLRRAILFNLLIRSFLIS